MQRWRSYCVVCVDNGHDVQREQLQQSLSQPMPGFDIVEIGFRNKNLEALNFLLGSRRNVQLIYALEGRMGDRTKLPEQF